MPLFEAAPLRLLCCRGTPNNPSRVAPSAVRVILKAKSHGSGLPDVRPK